MHVLTILILLLYYFFLYQYVCFLTRHRHLQYLYYNVNFSYVIISYTLLFSPNYALFFFVIFLYYYFLFFIICIIFLIFFSSLFSLKLFKYIFMDHYFSHALLFLCQKITSIYLLFLDYHYILHVIISYTSLFLHYKFIICHYFYIINFFCILSLCI